MSSLLFRGGIFRQVTLIAGLNSFECFTRIAEQVALQ
jgi:hypothetical protein